MIAALLLFPASLSGAPVARDSLYGTVRVVGTGEAIPGVIVTVQGSAATALSDSAGAYVLRDLPEGRLAIQYERVGFDPLSVHVAVEGSAARVDVDLARVPIALPPVTIIPGDFDASRSVDDSGEIGDLHLNAVLARRDPLVGEPDVFQALQSAPFIQGREEFASSLHVRGGAGDENLVLLDGLPWHGPRPLGGIAGLLPAGVVRGVDVYTAAPSPRYGDALSSIIVVHPATGDRFTATGLLDASSIEQTLGSPLPLVGASVLVGARSTYRSVFDRPEGASESENGFQDVFGRLSIPDRTGRFDIYYLRDGDRLTFPAALDSSAATNRFTAGGSLTGIVSTHALGAGSAAQVRLWSSGAWSGATWGARRLAASLRDVGLSAVVTSDRTEAGFALSRTVTGYRAEDAGGTGVELNGAPLVFSVFAARRWTPATAWTLSSGVRLNAARGWGVQIEPRIWSRLTLGPAVAFSLGLARTHQYIQSARNEESILDAVVGTDLPVGAQAGGLPPARADQLTAALEARLGECSVVHLEGYARRLSGLALVAPATGLPFAVGPIPVGWGAVRGADVMVSYLGPRLDLRGTVGVLDASRHLGSEGYRPSDEAIRATVGIGYRLARWTVARLALHVGDGRPTTWLQDGLQLEPYAPLDGAGSLAGSPTAVAGPVNPARLPTYARVDFGLTRELDLGVHATASVTILNLLDRHNVLAYVTARDGLRPVFLLPRTLLLRLRWSLDEG